MKKVFFLLSMSLMSLAVINTSAQETDAPKGKTVAPSKDHVMVQFHYDNWAKMPDSFSANGINRGVSFYIMYDFALGNSNFSFAPGLGVGVHNYYFKDHRVVLGEGNNTIQFRKLVGPDATNYKSSKLTTGYLEMPLELRFFSDKYNRNKGFKAALGLKVGYLINAHTKDKVVTNSLLTTQKYAQKAYFQTWSFAPTLRLGWGNFSVFGQYSLSQQFMQGKGPEMYPWSVGITISGM